MDGDYEDEEGDDDDAYSHRLPYSCASQLALVGDDDDDDLNDDDEEDYDYDDDDDASPLPHSCASQLALVGALPTF